MEWKKLRRKIQVPAYIQFFISIVFWIGGAWAVWNTAACGLCFYGNVTGVQYQYYFIDIFTG